MAPLPAPLIVYSHLRWDEIWRRPQHVMSRISRRRRVLFVEEPMHAGSAMSRWELREEGALQVATPFTPLETPGFGGEQEATLERMLRDLIAERGDHDHVAWLYTPMAVPLARAMSPRHVVYDCMEDLSMLEGAPEEMAERERELLGWADVVFTGGPSLFRSRQNRHPNVHCLPSSADAAHFASARAGLEEPEVERELERPRLGYFGRLDERLDRGLLAALADARPEWSWVMIGPRTGAHAQEFPERPNLHYLGARPYRELPAHAASWDVCLIPFAMTAATRFISPTKTLEYMAAERPIVSTPIPDVADLYADIVNIGATPEGFLAGCERALNEDGVARARRIARMRDVLRRTSWEATVSTMESQLRRVETPSLRTRPPAPMHHRVGR